LTIICSNGSRSNTCWKESAPLDVNMDLAWLVVMMGRSRRRDASTFSSK
jgi:hypothetical protein